MRSSMLYYDSKLALQMSACHKTNGIAKYNKQFTILLF